MLNGRIWSCFLSAVLLVCSVAAAVGLSTRLADGGKTFSPEAKLYWALDKLLAQKQADKAKQLVQADAETARKLLANLLFVELDLALELEDAEPISPNMGEILPLLEAVADEQLKRLMSLISSVRQGLNLFRGENSRLAGALSAFVDAARVEGSGGQISLWQNSLQKCRELGLELGELVCLYRLGRVERDKGDLAPALAHLLKAKELAERWDYKARLPAILNALGVTLYRLGLLETAYRQLLTALELAKQQGNGRMQGMILTNLSAVAIQWGNFRWAAEFLQEALNCGRTATRLLNLGAVYTYLRDYENALPAFQEALELAEKANDIPRQVLAWNNIGEVYRLQGNYEQALHCLQRALKLSQQTQDIYRTIPVHLTLGLIYTDMRDFENAERHFNELLRLSRQLGDRLREVGALIRLGHLRNRQGEWGKAEGLLKEAVKIAAQINHQPSQALALMTLGVAFEEQNRFDEALAAYREALSIWQGSGVDWLLAWTWKNIGDAYEKRGREKPDKEREIEWLQAIDAYWQSVRLMERVREGVGGETMGAQFAQNASEPFYKLADLLARIGRFDEAFEISERMRARALLELIQLAGMLEREQMTEQESAEYDALKQRVAELEEQLARLLAEPSPDLNRVSKLRRELEEARNEFERLRDFQRLQRWKLLPLRQKQIAFNVWRQLKLPEDTAVLTYIVTEQRTWLFVLWQEKGNWRIQCYNLPVTQKQLEEDIAWLRERVEHRKPVGSTLYRLYTSLFAPAEKALKGKRKLIVIPDGPLYALPFQALQDENSTYLIERFTVTYVPSLTTLAALQQRDSLNEQIATISSRVGDGFSKSLGTSHDATVRSQSASGRVRLLPNQRNLGSPKGSPSQSGLDFRTHSPPKPKLLWTGLAVSTFDGVMEPLPYARREVQQIASLLKQAKLTLPIRSQVDSGATKAAALQALKESRWVHFATHAVLEPKRPLYSQLIFASGKGQDKTLRAFEVLDLGQTSCEMVVLSACETGLGKILQGEGLLGLVWAFMGVGTKTLVVSQWRVNDLSTAHLMREYYSQLLKGLPPAEAMRRAQISLLSQRQFHHPYHWASFVVWGKGF